MKGNENNWKSQWTAVFATLALISCIIPGDCSAQQKKKVTVEIGQPSVWSMAQAHYLLAKMHQANETLKSRLPDENDLDPNAANAFRLITRLNSVEAEVQYNQSMGLTNQLAANQYRSDVAQKQAAQNQVMQLLQTRDKLERKLATINTQLASLASQAAPLQAIPTAQLTADQTQQLASLTQQMAPLNDAKTALTDQITQVNNDITTENTQATASVSLPAFQEPNFTTQPGTEVPKSSAYDTFVGNALKGFKSPNIDPHTALDNSIGMQYEIISKQLTLLRDEVGPDERVIFLELPASIYTVDGKADDYVVQLGWDVTKYYDDIDYMRWIVIPQVEESKFEQAKHAGEPEERTLLNNIQTHLNAYNFKIEGYESKTDGAQSPQDVTRAERLTKVLHEPITLDMILSKYNRADWKSVEEKSAGGETVSKLNVRALDVIPRQSALNVNEYHANVSHFGILGAFKFLFGLGVQLNIQRQREVYEQFLQQEIFASGFGKGSNAFGWTFGPMPGSKRIAPGVKTTYAVLAVPKDTLALKLHVVGRAYKKDRSPYEASADLTFDKDIVIKIPGEETERFWASDIWYTPVKKGGKVTVVLEGNYFSPQLGLMVNGVPLKADVSIANNVDSRNQPSTPGQDVSGEFEMLNSHEIIATFSMGSQYVGIPTITLVSPEKTADINSFHMKINGREEQLSDLAAEDPMFREDLKIDRVSVSSNGDWHALRLTGSGFRRHAEIFINGNRIDRVCQTSSREYTGFMRDVPPDDTWTVRLEQRSGQDTESAEVSYNVTPIKCQINRYNIYADGHAEASVTLTGTNFRGSPIAVINGEFSVSATTASGPDKWSGTLQIAARPNSATPASRVSGGATPARPPRDVISISMNTDFGPRSIDVPLPLIPSIAKVDKPSGTYDQPQTVVITGSRLKHVARVYFGDTAAQILGVPGDGVLTVSVPKGPQVADGQSLKVPIRLETDINLAGQRVTNVDDLAYSTAYFEYQGHPRAKKDKTADAK